MGAPVRRVVNNVNTIVLHGNDYVEVAERIRVVHQVKESVEMLESEPREYGGRLVWRVVIKVNERQYIGNAEVKLDAPKGSPDGTNPFECAETSAIGRALAFAGVGTVQSIASYDEIARGKPFVREIENPQNVVAAGNTPKQIEQAKPQVTKDQLVPLYKRGGRLKLYANEEEFWAWVAHKLGKEYVDLSMLTSDNLFDLGGEMDKHEAQLAKAS